MTSNNQSVSRSVTKTAIDALNAKHSAVSVGYNPVEKNGHIYKKLLDDTMFHKSPEPSQIKRQSPLVNAGYAARVSVISKVIINFIHHNSNMNGKVVNVVLMGCGLDVIGLWANSLSPSRIKVYEIDCWENGTLKRDTLLSMGLLDDFKVGEINSQDKNQKNKDNSTILSSAHINWNKYGCCIDDQDQDEGQMIGCNYTLLSANLSCSSSLELAFSSVEMDTSCPTIVLSELVLAYLGYACSNNVLQYIAKTICESKGSMFVGYEPIGFFTSESSEENIDTQNGVTTVSQGYTIDYYAKLTSKLNRGLQKQSIHQVKKDEFQPLALNCHALVDRLRGCMFDGPIDACLSGTPLARSKHVLHCTEPFDEHASLALHLQCYALACASSSKTTISEFRTICPWLESASVATKGMGAWYQQRINSGVVEKSSILDVISISSIRKEHQEQVRLLFKNTYIHLFEDYPSIRKMVKTALKVELSGKESIKLVNNWGESKGAIWNRYSQLGGAFWVVTNTFRNPNKNSDFSIVEISHCSNIGNKSFSKNNNDLGGEGIEVIGCIGINPLLKEPVSSISHFKYEIQRLIVDTRFRGLGIGKQLLKTAKDFVLQKKLDNSNTCEIVATTPAMMHEANHFYSVNNFRLEKEVNIGTMVINEYILVI